MGKSSPYLALMGCSLQVLRPSVLRCPCFGDEVARELQLKKALNEHIYLFMREITNLMRVQRSFRTRAGPCIMCHSQREPQFHSAPSHLFLPHGKASSGPAIMLPTHQTICTYHTLFDWDVFFMIHRGICRKHFENPGPADRFRGCCAQIAQSSA